jgi:hypothetical protein
MLVPSTSFRAAALGAEAEGWLMDWQRPRPSPWSGTWLPLCAAASLAACQFLPQPSFLSDQQAEPEVGAWRVVERLGEARYLAPSMAAWEQITPRGLIPAGSQIATGIGGRLIVHEADNQLSAGTNSRFVLPGWESGDSMLQTEGWLRYRIAGEPDASFAIETPFLDLLVDDAVLDVTVGDSETEVSVVSGRVRVKTLDGRRQIDLHAGYTGYASMEGDVLAIRRGPDQRLEQVPATVVPALHPDRAASGSAQSPALAASVMATSESAATVIPATAPPSDPSASAMPAPATAAAPSALNSEPSLEALESPVALTGMQRPAMTSPTPPPPADPATISAAVPAMVALDQIIATPAPEPAKSQATSPADPVGLAETTLVPAGFTTRPSASQRRDPEQTEIRRRFEGLTRGLLAGLLPAELSGAQLDRR